MNYLPWIAGGAALGYAARGRRVRALKPRGNWQAEVLREMKEMGYPPTWENLVNQANSYDDQLEGRYGEGSHPEGRKHLRSLVNAATALADRAARMEWHG